MNAIHKRMIQNLPRYERKNKLITEILRTVAIELQKLNGQTDQSYKELFIDTALKALQIHAKDLGLKFGNNLSVKQQREIIGAQYMAAFHQTTEAKLIAIVKAFSNSDVEINETDEPGVFEIALISKEVRLENQKGLHQVLSDTIPAHLAFFIAVILKMDEIVIRAKSYEFGVIYPITNMFTTAALPGVMTKIAVNVQQSDYTFGATYRITNEFTTEGYEGRVVIGADSTLKFDAYDAPFTRLGECDIGGGLRLGGYVDDEETIRDRIMMQTNVSAIDVEGNDLGSLAISADTENSDVIYKRTNDIYLGEGDL